MHAGSSFLSYLLSSFPGDSVQGAKAFHDEEADTITHRKIEPLDLINKSVPELLDQVRTCLQGQYLLFACCVWKSTESTC